MIGETLNIDKFAETRGLKRRPAVKDQLMPHLDEIRAAIADGHTATTIRAWLLEEHGIKVSQTRLWEVVHGEEY